MFGLKAVFVLTSVIALNLNTCYSIEKPQSPFIEEEQGIQEAHVTTTNDTVPKRRFVTLKNITIATYPSTET